MIRRKKSKVAVILFLLLVCIGIGYAALTTNLSINGTSDIIAANWNIRFQNVQVTQGSVTATSAATINANADTVTYAVTLTKPGDFYEFTVDAKNNGTIDGMVGAVTSTLNGTPITTLPDYLDYYVTYADGIPVESNHLLAANSTETYRVHIAYKSNVTASQLPTTNQSLSLTFGITYNQANDSAVTRARYIYSISGTTFTIGNNIPNGVTTYNNPYDAISELGYPVVLRHKYENNTITESYVGIKINEEMYYIKGGDSGTSYASNKEIIHKAFGTNNCEEWYNNQYYRCYAPYSYAEIHTDGYAKISFNGRSGSIFENGESSTGY